MSGFHLYCINIRLVCIAINIHTEGMKLLTFLNAIGIHRQYIRRECIIAKIINVEQILSVNETWTF